MARAKQASAKAVGVTFSTYDTADYLKTEKQMAQYLDACLSEAGDDAGYIAEALGTIARAKGMSKIARDLEVTRAGLYKSLSKDGKPSFEIILKVIRALGMRLTVEAA